jgi:rsbT co-antagonist protein RsbR
MSTNHQTRIAEILKKFEPELLSEWIEEQKANIRQKALLKDTDLRKQCSQFLSLLQSSRP